MTISPPNLMKLLAPLAVFAVLLAVFFAINRDEAPSLPAIADAGSPSGDAVADYQRAVRAAPESATAFAGLGEAYLARARETGDPGLYSRAERAFDAALRRDPDDLGALIGSGNLAGLKHNFREQLRLGRLAVAEAPGLARPYTVVADAQIELGRYPEAAESIQRVLDVRPGLAAYSRASYYRELTGDPDGAVEAMRLAASAGGSPESVAYIQVLLGDLALGQGNSGTARVAYTSALRSLPGFPAGLVGLARADAAGGDLGRAAARLRRAAERLPLPATLVLLSEVERSLGHNDAAAAALAGATAQRRLFIAAGTAPDAESVLFEADHGSPARAVTLGRRVWRAAPSIRSADALAWALVRSGDPEAGLRWSRRALAPGSRDPLFRYHAGLAAVAAGGSGAHDLSIAIRGGGMLSPRQLKQAKEALR